MKALHAGVVSLIGTQSDGENRLWLVMFEDFSKRLFKALHKDAIAMLGRDHPCTLAISRAIKTDNQTDIQEAQKQLSALPSDVAEPLMKAAHKTLREDPAALLDMWSGERSGSSN